MTMATIPPRVAGAMAEQVKRVNRGDGVANYLNGNAPCQPKPARPVTMGDVDALRQENIRLQRQMAMLRSHALITRALVMWQQQKNAIPVAKPSAPAGQGTRHTISTGEAALRYNMTPNQVWRALTGKASVRLCGYQGANGQWRVYTDTPLERVGRKRKGAN